jgi:hypothetical protein
MLVPLRRSWLIMADFPFMLSQRLTIATEKSIDKSAIILLVIVFNLSSREVVKLRLHLKWQQVALKCLTA